MNVDNNQRPPWLNWLFLGIFLKILACWHSGNATGNASAQ